MLCFESRSALSYNMLYTHTLYIYIYMVWYNEKSSSLVWNEWNCVEWCGVECCGVEWSVAEWSAVEWSVAEWSVKHLLIKVLVNYSLIKMLNTIIILDIHVCYNIYTTYYLKTYMTYTQRKYKIRHNYIIFRIYITVLLFK